MKYADGHGREQGRCGCRARQAQRARPWARSPVLSNAAFRGGKHRSGGQAWRKTTRLQPSARSACEKPSRCGSNAPALRVVQGCHRASGRKHDPRACGRHADRTKTRNGYPKIARGWRLASRGRPSATWPGYRAAYRWRVRTRARVYESEVSVFRARASEQIASWCLRVGMLMKFRASSSSIRCCGVALNDCSPPWMPSKK